LHFCIIWAADRPRFSCVKDKEDDVGSSRVFFWLAVLAGAVLAGLAVGLNLPEERRNRVLKLVNEAKEMPFRLFV